MYEDIAEMITKKLLEDDLLLDKVNEYRNELNLELLTKNYIESIVRLTCRTRDEYAAANFDDMVVGIYGGVVWRKMMMATVGDIIKSHKHSYDHFSYIEKGTVDINGEIYNAGDWAKIPKNVLHTIKALSNDCITYCINSEHEVMENDK